MLLQVILLQEIAVGLLLTSEVLCQAKKQPHSLVVLVTWATGSTQYQSFSPWSSGSPKNTIYVCAFHHLQKDRGLKIKESLKIAKNK